MKNNSETVLHGENKKWENCHTDQFSKIFLNRNITFEIPLLTF
jgi:hypothetical protein